MPHQCVRCNTFYEDGSQEILKGCKCGAKLFFYVKKSALKKAEQMTSDLSQKEKEQIEKDVLDLVGSAKTDESPVVLDFEAIRVTKPGKFEVDLVKVFNSENPLVYKLGEGKYVIDINETFDRIRKEKNS